MDVVLCEFGRAQRKINVTRLCTSTTAETLAHSKRLKNKGATVTAHFSVALDLEEFFQFQFHPKRKIKFFALNQTNQLKDESQHYSLLFKANIKTNKKHLHSFYE